MASGNERSRNNIRAGLFVLMALVLGLGTFITLQKLNFGARHSYRLRFRVDTGVNGLFPGSEVRVGGLRRGRVLAITPIIEGGRLTRIEADIELDASITLYTNAEVMRVAPILGNTSWLNFSSIGGPRDSDGDGKVEQVQVLQPGGTLDAGEAPGLLANIVGGRSAERIVNIIERTETFSEILERAPADYKERILPAIDAASTTVVQLRDDYSGWRVKVDETLTSAAAAARNLESGTKDAEGLIADARSTLTENRGNILTTTGNLASASGTAKEIVDRIRDETLPQIAKVLGDGDQAIGELASLLDRADAALATTLPDIRTMVADLRSAAGQLKLATIEVRRSPWRLLYRPSTDVIAHEQLYDAARSYAAASADVRSATAGLEELLRVRPDLFNSNPELRDRLQKALLDSVTRYEEAQRRLYGVLVGDQ